MTMLSTDQLPAWLAASVRVEAARRGVSDETVLHEVADVLRRTVFTFGGFFVMRVPAGVEVLADEVSDEFHADVDSIMERFKPALDRLAVT